ncbi:MAG TPA: AraC family transcriptional regulator [Xanthomonadales bacterium]|nr:AraC family transcriptional regulator [Xanthomonadales bacterium]
MTDIFIFAPSAANLWAVIESYGVDPEPFFRNEGIELKLPIDAELRIPYQSVDAIRALAAAEVGDEAFGLKAGRFVHPSHLGALGYAWLASATLRIALQRLQRFVRILNARARLIMEERNDEVQIGIDVDLPSKNLVVRDDLACSVLATMIRYNLGPDFYPSFVTLKRDRPSDTKPWDTFYGCPVVFGADANTLTVPSAILDKVLPSANPGLAQLNEDIVVRYLERLDQADLPGRVRKEIVRHLPSDDFSQAVVAESLNMTPRTMRRWLRSHGTSFKSLVTEVRQELANKFVADDNISVTEMSFMLGFSEVSSFTRAFRNWHGFPPSEARQSAPHSTPS